MTQIEYPLNVYFADLDSIYTTLFESMYTGRNYKVHGNPYCTKKYYKRQSHVQKMKPCVLAVIVNLAILARTAEAASLTCEDVSTVYQDQQCCTDSDDPTCYNKLDVGWGIGGHPYESRTEPCVGEYDWIVTLSDCIDALTYLTSREPAQYQFTGVSDIDHGDYPSGCYQRVNEGAVLFNSGGFKTSCSSQSGLANNEAKYCLCKKRANLHLDNDGNLNTNDYIYAKNIYSQNGLKVDQSIRFQHGQSGKEFGIGGNNEDAIKIWVSNAKDYMDIGHEISGNPQIERLRIKSKLTEIENGVFGTCNVYDSASTRTSKFGIYLDTPEAVTCKKANSGTAVSYPFVFNRNTMFNDHVNMQSVQINRQLYVERDLKVQKGVLLNNQCYTKDFYDANPGSCKTEMYGDLDAKGRTNYFDICGSKRGCTDNTARKVTFGSGSAANRLYPFRVNEQAYFNDHTHFADSLTVTDSGRFKQDLEVGGELYLYQEGVSGSQTYGIASGDSTINRGLQFKIHGGAHYADFQSFNYIRVQPAEVIAEGYKTSSDRRIKNDIVEIPDALALETFRGLEAKYYYYENNDKSDVRQIGFIAQEVREAIPEAVILGKGTLPDEQRVVEVLWQEVVNSTEYSMELSLETLAPGKYKFKFPGDGSMAELETLDGKTFLTGDGKVWTSKTKHSEVELFGSIVDDFHYIDKDKIFTVAYAAMQEMDRTQQALLLTIASLEARLAALEA